MDIVERLRTAVRELPQGGHTAGLSAIVRHVDAAVRHFERATSSDDPEAFTDCIYRTNQVYEGSLKEAYRLLSGVVPGRTTLHDIEKYFDGNRALRNRVLVQMRRYREDYRNPSTHDYKLDFDENEALLAILSVAAFASLLVSQMKGHLQTEAIVNDPAFQPETVDSSASTSEGAFALQLAHSLQQFLNDESEHIALESREPLALVSAYLERSGLNLVRDLYVETDESWYSWDMLVSNAQSHTVPIEVITSRGRYSDEVAASRIAQVRDFALASAFKHAILVEGAGRGTKYVCEQPIEDEDLTIYRVGRPRTQTARM